MKRRLSRLRSFFAPTPGAPLVKILAPYGLLAFIGLVIILATTVGWNYTNSNIFCGTTCHTMPPQYATFLRSPHSRVSCVECHIGRESLDVMLPRKVLHSETVYAMLFHKYEYPIVAEKMRPANEACETCHYPGSFSTDSLKEIKTHANDETNTSLSTYLLLRTGGGAKREGLGKGIHWHIQNKVEYIATDKLEQTIPYVRVTYDDGTIKDFIDVTPGVSIDQASSVGFKKVDCITCHNRITHNIPSPAQAVDTALNTGVISNDLPYVRQKAVELLSGDYADQDTAALSFKKLAAFYEQSYPQVYKDKRQLIKQAVDFLTSTFAQTHFSDQKLDWTSHPDNVGHRDSAGCFRCHDGKHLTASGESIRLECNLCHSIPQAATPAQFVTDVSILRGPEPASHTHSLWIGLHGKVVDQTCARCHPAKDPNQDWTSLNGQKPPADGSFCGNSLCHQVEWKFAGFASPALEPVLQEQIPKAEGLNKVP